MFIRGPNANASLLEPRARSGHVEPFLRRHGGLVPAIHVFLTEGRKRDVDARDKRGHDGGESIRFDPIGAGSVRIEITRFATVAAIGEIASWTCGLSLSAARFGVIMTLEFDDVCRLRARP